MTEQTSTPKQPTTDEIDLIEVIRHIWNGRWLIVKVTVGFIVLGLVIALGTTSQYKAEARLLPEIKDMGGSASSLLRQFGGLGGLNLPMAEGADAIRPDLYPDVINSTPFFLELMSQKVTTEDGEQLSVYDFVNEEMKGGAGATIAKYTIKLPWTIAGALKGEDESANSPALPGDTITSLTVMQYETILTLRDRITANMDQRSGVINISAEFPDRQVAAQIARFSVNYLGSYITDYRTEKATQDMLFVQQRYEEKKSEFHQSQLALARFRDSNRNIISAAVQAEEQRLEDQYNLAFNVYNGLAQQLEQSRIKVQEETPVIKVLEPVTVPVERSKPKRGMIMVVSAFMGVIVGLGWVFGRILVGNIRKGLKEANA
jgi:uncharacterized protein involved in exopolysaccharide biosynthesis